MPAASETLPAVERRLAERLLGYELLDMPPGRRVNSSQPAAAEIVIQALRNVTLTR